MKMWSEQLRDSRNIRVGAHAAKRCCSFAAVQDIDIEANVTSKRMIHDEIVAKIKVKVKCSGILEC